MTRVSPTTGRLLYGAAMLGFGLQSILCAARLQGPAIAAPWLCGPPAPTWFAALAFLAVALCCLSGRMVRAAGWTFGAVLLLYATLEFVPTLIEHPGTADAWTNLFEVAGLAGGAWVLARGASPDVTRNRDSAHTLPLTGRLLFTSSLVVFGVQHFLYTRYVASLVPAWLPGHFFWAHFTGMAFFAAALSIFTSVARRLASALLALMFLLWVILVHAPRVAHALNSGDEWTSALIPLAMSGAACSVAAERTR